MSRPVASRLVAGCLLVTLAPACALAGSALGIDGNVRLPNPFSGDGQYGYGMTAGDFDGDGVRDLAVARNGGIDVRVLLGQTWVVGAPGPVMKFSASSFDAGTGFNASTLVSGDFNGDGRDELAFGNPSYSASVPSGGRAYVAQRSAGGVWSIAETIQQGSNGYAGAHEAGDKFGSALAVGDFDNDGYEDLAISALDEAVGTTTGAGAVLIAYGSATGITSARDHLVTRDNDGLTFTPGVDDNYGWSLASGDFDADGYADLAIGAVGALCPDGTTHGGAVIVMYGSASGLSNTRTKIFRRGVNGMAGTCTGGELFGMKMVAAGFDGGLTSDLAIGSYSDGVHVLYSDANGLATAGDQHFTTTNVPGATSDSNFGSQLAAGRLRSNSATPLFGGASLVIGAPQDDVDGFDKAGSVTVLHATGSGLKAASAERWTRKASLVIGAPAAEDRFGSALAVGDFNDDGAGDLAIGVPNYDSGSTVDDGAAVVLYGSEFIFRDGFE